MKFSIVLLFLLLCFNKNSYSKSLSNTEKLYATAKVWGYLKYYHPKVAAGKFDWDQQLFDILPIVEKAADKTQLSLLLNGWIASFGKIKSRVKKSSHDYFDQNFNLAWIEDDTYFSDALSATLKCIETKRHQGNKYYVSYVKGNSGYVKITNEKPYQNIAWQKQEYRLLSLFRYWNIIEYFFPHKYQTDKNWDAILIEMIPKFLNANSEVDYHLAMLSLVASIDDSHGSFVTPQTFNYFGNKFIPAQISLVDNKAIITKFRDDSLATVNDLQIGDIITKVNNRFVESIYLENEQYIMGSNKPRKMYSSQSFIFKGSSDSLEIEFVRKGISYSKTIKRYPYDQFKKKAVNAVGFKMLDNNVGYLNLNQITKDEIGSVLQQFSTTKAIIIDIRKKSKGTINIISDFITTERTDFYSAIAPDLNYPGRFIWNKGYQVGNGEGERYKGKVVLLVNEGTQSHSEFTAMCLQAGDNVVTVGSQTSGADGKVSSFEMVGGFKTSFTGYGIFYPDKTETQRKGIKIDIELKPTIEGVSNGKDEQLERAIQVANGKK
ncbi:MAG: hypothetical protein GQ574_00975 [Crocinitomix sp.]|nr:hypothetical protein [Crocinitomix sp.]